MKNEIDSKYVVYRNDIKYKNYRNIDPNRARWKSDVENDYKYKDTDSIEYRIYDCEKENYETLDLSHMESDCFDKLFSNKLFMTIRNKLKHIFARDSNISRIHDLDEFTSLQTLDISNNKLTHIPKLPISIEELIVNDNNITNIDNDLPNLKRLNAKNNKICKINYNRNIESMYINNNPISEITRLDKIYYLDISNTNIDNLESLPSLTYLDCSHTKIQHIPKMDLLEHLICSESNVQDIDTMNSLKFLEIINTKVKKLKYMRNLCAMSYHNDNNFDISSSYKIKFIKKNKADIIEILFN
jgi:Leucine-rich repeat (LRR) protein